MDYQTKKSWENNTMRNQRKLKRISGFLGFSLLLANMILNPINVAAQNKTEQITGKFYEFGEKSKYEISSATTTSSVTPLGTLNISGDYKTTGSGDDIQYDVSKGNLTLTYTFDSSILNNPMHAYIEVISFDKLINDSEKRNRILFDKLGI